MQNEKQLDGNIAQEMRSILTKFFVFPEVKVKLLLTNFFTFSLNIKIISLKPVPQNALMSSLK
jgi:hypothetical protein